jgi:hypothetical protein
MEAQDDHRFKRRIFVIILIFSTLLVSLGHTYYVYEKKQVYDEKANELMAISRLKVEQLKQWKKERMSEALFFTTSYPNDSLARLSLQGNKAAASLYRGALQRMITDFRYRNIYLMNPAGQILLSVNPEQPVRCPLLEKLADAVCKTGKVHFSDLYYCQQDMSMHYDILAPVYDREGRVKGILTFLINPHDYLYPLIMSWPTPTKTGEALLIRDEGDSVSILSPLRKQVKFDRPLAFSRQDNRLPIRQMIGHQKGYFEGNDYKGQKALYCSAPVEGTPWWLNVKVDTSEIDAKISADGTT